MLTPLLELTQEMLAQAEQSEWERVGQLQEQRLQLMDQLFPLDPPPDQAERVKVQLESLLEIDRSLTALVESQRQEAGAALGKLSQGRQATRAYQKASRY